MMLLVVLKLPPVSVLLLASSVQLKIFKTWDLDLLLEKSVRLVQLFSSPFPKMV
jgi:hypothetical protein